LHKIQNLFYRQGSFYLEASELKLPEEGLVLLNGLSGSGKSTFLNILAGLLDCPSLVWIFKGKNLVERPPPERGINYCFQDLRLFPLMTAKENILFALQARKIPIKEKQKDFEKITVALGLKACLNLSIDKLSGGEKQRTALARALLSPCEILFLDEPFSYLDKTNKQKAKDFVRSYIDKNKIFCFLAEHEKEEAVSHQVKFHEGSIQMTEIGRK